MSIRINKNTFKTNFRVNLSGGRKTIEYKKSNETAFVPAKFVGYNYIYANDANKFAKNELSYLSYQSNPHYHETTLLGFGNHDDARYPNPVRANAQRVYFSDVKTVTTIPGFVPSQTSAQVAVKNKIPFGFYIDPLWDLNIAFNDVTKAIITTNWTPAMVSANNGTLNTLKLNQWTPRFLCQGSNGFVWAKAGRVLGIGNSSNVTPQLMSNSVAGITITITDNGSGMSVNGIAQTSYTIPTTKLKVAENCGQVYTLTDVGSGVVATAKNRGCYGLFTKVDSYEYIDPTHSTNELFEGAIVGRPSTSEFTVPNTVSVGIMGNDGGEDYYAPENVNTGNNKFSFIRDILVFRPVCNVGDVADTTQIKLAPTTFIDIYFRNDYTSGGLGGDPYYDYEVQKYFESKETEKVARTYYVSDTLLVKQLKKAEKYGVFTFVNAFWSFQNYGYSVYGGTETEIKANRLIAQQNYIDEIQRKVDIIIDELGYCLLILGNETNNESNLKGSIYETTYPGITSNSYIWFADMDNQNLQSNVNAMMNFFNQIAGMLKARYGDKIIVGPSVSFAAKSQCDNILAAQGAGFASNFDVIFNNFYANGSTADPYITFEGFNPMSYFDANQTGTKLNIILSECGIPRKCIDVNNVPNGYKRLEGSSGFSSTNFSNYTDYETEQGTIASNLIKKSVGNAPVYTNVQGLFLFGNGDQPHRGSLESKYGASIFPSFYIPAKNFVSLADNKNWVDYLVANPSNGGSASGIPNGKVMIWEEKFMSHLWKDTPRAYNPSGSQFQATALEDSLAVLQTKESNAMTQVRTAMTTVPNVKYAG